MNKVILTLILCLIFCNIGFAESYYFKECKLTQTLTGNYVIDFDKNLINVRLKAADGSYQEFADKIELITKDNVKPIRPGYGLHPKYFNKLMGRKLKKTARKGTPFKKNMA